MPYRPLAHRWKLTARIDEVKSLANTFVRRPRALGAWIEARSPWLNRQFLGVASNLAEPFTAGMGLKVAKLGEDVAEVLLPDSWRNQGSAGGIHPAALAVLGEMAARIFWEHHLDLRAADAAVKRLQVRLLAPAKGELRGAYRISVAEREAILLKLRSDGRVEIETHTLVYDQAGRMIAEVEAELELHRQLALGSNTDPA